MSIFETDGHDGFREVSPEEFEARTASDRARYEAARRTAADIVAELSEGERWALKQALADEGRYYGGGGGMIHHTGQLDVETHRGQVVAVWFRCQLLPFQQVDVESGRAAEMRSASDLPTLTGVEVRDPQRAEVIR